MCPKAPDNIFERLNSYKKEKAQKREDSNNNNNDKSEGTGESEGAQKSK